MNIRQLLTSLYTTICFCGLMVVLLKPVVGGSFEPLPFAILMGCLLVSFFIPEKEDTSKKSKYS